MMWPFGATVRSRGLNSGSVTKRRGCGRVGIEREDRVVALAGRADARGEIQAAVPPETEPAWEWDDAFREEWFRVAVERRRDAQNRPAAAHREVEATVWPEHGAAGRGRPSALSRARRVHCDRGRASGPRCSGRSARRRVDPETTRIDDPGVVAEVPYQFPGCVEAEQRVVATAVGATPALVTRKRTKPMLARISGGLRPATGTHGATSRRLVDRHQRRQSTATSGALH